MKEETTIYDIAHLLDLSAATVSRALKDHPAINSKTKELVIAKANELGYRSNKFASNLRRKRTNTLGVIVPKLDSAFMSSVLAGMEKVANNAGYHLLIMQSLESELKEKANVETMFSNRVDGLLVSLAFDTVGLEHFEKFFQRKIPVLFFDRNMDDSSCCSIVIDNCKAGYELTNHLIEQGCRNLMHVTGNLNRNVYDLRFRGFKRALLENEVVFDPAQLIINDLSEEAGEQVAHHFHSMAVKPDGIFITNDFCATSCVRTLKKLGYRIPDDLAIAGFNNDPVSRFIEPQLTTINYPGKLMGETAVNRMIDALDTGIAYNKTEILPYSLLIRSSTTKTAVIEKFA